MLYLPIYMTMFLQQTKAEEAIMTKLGFVKSRIGHEKRRGYWVREKMQPEIDQMRHPDFF